MDHGRALSSAIGQLICWGSAQFYGELTLTSIAAFLGRRLICQDTLIDKIETTTHANNVLIFRVFSWFKLGLNCNQIKMHWPLLDRFSRVVLNFSV